MDATYLGVPATNLVVGATRHSGIKGADYKPGYWFGNRSATEPGDRTGVPVLRRGVLRAVIEQRPLRATVGAPSFVKRTPGPPDL